MSHRVIDNTTGLTIETWEGREVSHNQGVKQSTGWHASRACMLFSAWEMKNGRVGSFRVEPTIFIPYSMDSLELPDWVYEVLGVQRGEEEKG